MFVRYNSALGAVSPKRTSLLLLVLLSCLSAGCVNEPLPRSYMEFMEDSLAREGTLARCNRDREATSGDAECMNARRAAATIAARADEALRAEREVESEVQRVAASERAARAQQARDQAEAVAEAQAEADYEAQWDQNAEIVLAEGETAVSVPVPEARTSMEPGLGTSPEVPAEPGFVGPPLPGPSLEFVELPESAAPALPYVELPENIRRLEFEPEPELQLEEVSIPSTATYRE